MRQVIGTLVLGFCFVIGLAAQAPVASAGDFVKCNFDSECHKGSKCNGGTCSDAPGGKCNFDSECNGKKCSGGTCK